MDNFYKKPTKENPYVGLRDGKWRSISEALNEMVHLLESDVISKEVKVSIIPTAHELCAVENGSVFRSGAEKITKRRRKNAGRENRNEIRESIEEV